MSENISEIDVINKDEVATKEQQIEKTPETAITPENSDKNESLCESDAIQSETHENPSETSNQIGNAVTDDVIDKSNELEQTGEKNASEEVIDKPPDDCDKAATVQESECVSREPTNNGEVDVDEENIKSDSDHEGEVEDLEEPDECDSSNEVIIGGDDKLTDLVESETESHHQHKKNRRRILVDDSDESEVELERDEILRSCTPENSKQGTSTGFNSEEEEVVSEKDEKVEDSPVELDPEVSEIIAKEKPGPKSKKSSVYLKLEQEYEARHLFKNAIIIPAVEKKKKPKRVLASEDEESDEKSREPDVFGIGIEEPMNDEESRLSGANILLCENYSVDPNFIPLEGVKVDAIPEIIPLENPILPQEDEVRQEQASIKHEPSSNKDETSTTVDIKPNVAELQQGNFLNPDKSPEYGTLAPAAPSAPSNVTEFSMEDTSGAPTILADLSDNNKAPQLLVIKKEPELDQKASEQFLADALRAQFTDNAPTSIKKLEANTEVDMNTTFWGRDSSSSSSEDDWTSNMFNSGSSKKSSKSYNYYASMKSGGKKRKRDRYESTSESSSSSSDSRHRRKKKNSKSSHHVKKTIYLHKQNQTLRTAIKGYSKKDIKKKVKDRFFDRSLLIPNDIYFGDTKVSDSVLHAYNSDALTSSDSDDGWFQQVLPPAKLNKYKTSYNKNK